MTPYDRSYAATDRLFGDAPEATLLRYLKRLAPDRPVLDIGAGQGRNTLPVARAGISVVALDPSRVGLDSLRRRAEAENLPVTPVLGGFEEHDAQPGHYGGVLTFGLIPDLDWAAIFRLRGSCVRWLAAGGLVFVTGFTTEDPAMGRFRTQWLEVGLNSFADPGPHGGGPESPAERVRTYLAPGQIVELFPSLEVLHHDEGLGPVHRHGDGPPERHGRFEAVLRRTG